MSYCPACGAALPVGAAFCTNCGRAVYPAPQPVTAAAHGAPPGWAPAPGHPPTAPAGPLGEHRPAPYPPLVVPSAPAFDPRTLFPAAWQSAGVVAGALIILTVLVAVADRLFVPEDYQGTFSNWLSEALQALCLAVGGSVSATVTGDDSGVNGLITARVMPFLAAALLLVPIVVLARLEERRSAPHRAIPAARAMVHGLTVAILVGFGALFATDTWGVSGADLTVAPDIGVTVAAGAVVVGAVSYLARLTTHGRLPILRLPVRLVLHVLAATAAVGLVVLLAGVYSTDDPSEPVLAALLVGVVALPAAALVVFGVPVSAGGSGSFTGGLAALIGESVDTGPREVGYGLVTDPSRWTLLLLIPLLVTVIAATRHTLSRPVAEWHRRVDGVVVAGTAGVTALVFLAVALAQRASGTVTVGAIGSYSGHAGPSMPAAVLAGLIWGALAALALRVAPSLALAAPAVTRQLPGRIDASWQPLLGGDAPAPEGTLSPRRTRWIAGVVVALVVTAGAGVATAAAVAKAFHTPERAAVAYLEAIGRGDAEAALEMREDGRQSTALQHDDALRADGVRRPADVAVTSSHRTGDQAEVGLRFTLDGTAASLSLTLRTRSGQFPSWRVTSPLGSVSAAQGPDFPVTVAGEWVGAAPQNVFPARYPVRIIDQLGVVADQNPTVDVLDQPVRVEQRAPVLTAKGEETVRTAVDEAIDACVRNPEFATCPFSRAAVPNGALPGAIVYRVLSRPAVRLAANPDGTIAVTTSRAGQIAYTFDADDDLYDYSGTLPLDADATVKRTSGLTVVFD